MSTGAVTDTARNPPRIPAGRSHLDETKPGWVLGEVLLLQLGVLPLLHRACVFAWPTLGPWQVRTLGFPYPATKYLLMALLALAAIGWSGRRFCDYGFRVDGLGAQTRIAAAAFLPFMLAGLPFAFGALPNRLPDACVLAVVQVAVVAYIGWQCMSERRTSIAAILGGVALVGYSVAAVRVGHPSGVVGAVVVTLLFNGLCEELFFRGYMQGRLDAAFGKPFRAFGVQFGHGALITSAMFGLAHAWMFALPLASISSNWPWAIWTCFLGLGYSFVRENSNGLLAPILMHTLPHVLGIMFAGHV